MNRRAPLVAGVVVVLVAVLAFFLLVFPKFGELDEVEEQLDRAEAEETVLRAELLTLEEAAEQLPILERQLARFRRQVPPIADLPGLINQLQNAADISGVDFFSIAPGQPIAAPAGSVAEIPAQIQVIGGFFPVDEFLFRLETLPRAAKVTTITVGEGEDGLPQIDVQLQATFYTTDLSAGPGAAAGPAGTPAATPAGTAPTTAPPASPSPGATTTPAGEGG